MAEARPAEHRPELIIFDNPERLFHAAAEVLVRELSDRSEGAVCSVTLSGGSTPAGLYARLSADARLRWDTIDVFWGDERYVPTTHPDSNYRMAHELFLSTVRIPPANVHRIPTEDPDPDRAARRYEDEVRRVFHLGAADFPRFDVTLLGLGQDGHTASLFPRSPALNERRRIAVSVRIDSARVRITLTPPAINSSACVIFLVAGSEKAAALRAVLREPFDPQRWPAQIIRPPRGRLRFLVDRDAASLL